nr:MAG TPA: hypothetical protein [Caudoviricetes sp.]
MELQSIKATSTKNIFILTYVDRMWHEFSIQLAYGDLSPIITIVYPFSAYRYGCSDSRFRISRAFNPVTMKKCSEEFLNSIEARIDTRELEEKMRNFKWQA